MATKEGKATVEVRESASRQGFVLMRNNNGGLPDRNGRLVRFGLGNETKELNSQMAFGDLVGWYNLEITQEMVGKTLPVFAMIEVKSEEEFSQVVKRAVANPEADERPSAQLRAINFVLENNGVAWFASSAEHVDQIVDYYLQEIKSER